MRRFVDDDAGYLTWLAGHPGGFVLNLLRSGGVAGLMLHRATCPTISGTPARGAHWTEAWIKVCGDRDELQRFASRLGAEPRWCGRCLRALASHRHTATPRRVTAATPRMPVLASAAPATVQPHDQPVRYRRPESPPVELPLRPRLASWNKAGDPDQLRLTQYLDTVQELLASRIAALPDPLALRLDVGLPDTVHLLDAHDLDNYLYPLAARLTAATGRQFVTVWGTKQHAERSWVRVEQAQPDLAPATFAASALTTTSASSQSTAYKQQLRDELLHLEPLSAGPVRLDLAFLVGARRNWTNLWKPTIDALTPILGPTRPDREWHPRDGRIVELGLHLRAHPDRRTDVTIAVRAQHSATN